MTDYVDKNYLFQVEINTPDIAIAPVLNQNGHPVAFFLRLLQKSDLKHPSIEKEICTIIEAVKYWWHYLTGHHFRLITDHQPVSYPTSLKSNRSKIKNDKIYYL